MAHLKFTRRCAAFILAAMAALTLSLPAFAAENHYLINGVASGSRPSGLLNPPTPSELARDETGADHSSRRLGLVNVTDKMRQNGPAFYGVKSSKEANAPELPAPKDAAALTPAQLAEKYHITIIDRAGYLTGPYGAQAVSLIDAGLQKYSAEFVRTLVDKWAQRGVFFCLNLYYPKASDGFKGATEIDSSTVCVNLVVPSGANPGGVSVGTVAHEFGHAVFLYLEKQMGQNNLSRQWRALNGSFEYGSRDADRAQAFVSDYGSMYYYEDPATIFEAFADAPEITAKKLAEKDYSLLRKKAEFLTQSVEKYIGTPGTLFSAVWDALKQ